MTTERDLIQRLADELQDWIKYVSSEFNDPCKDEQALIAEARAFLDQGEPEGPTEEEMNDLFWKHSSSIGDGGCGPGVGLAVEDAPALIREALTRWGRNTTKETL